MDDHSLPMGWNSDHAVKIQKGKKKFLFNSKIAVYKYLKSILEQAHTVYTVEEFISLRENFGLSWQFGFYMTNVHYCPNICFLQKF